ncbi:MAG: hypothetical protein ACI8T1_004286 [Verrucomicrobiales bacterium]|jgi:hypothetical protein
MACNLGEMPTPEVLQAALPVLRVLELTGGDAHLAVFLAEQTRVSLLVMLTPHTSEGLLKQLRPWMSLEHPYTHTIHHLELANGWPCVTASPLPGTLLSDALIDQEWALPKASALFSELCEALRDMHQHGIAHGKPDGESVYVRADGHILVSMIGFSRTEDASLRTLPR